MSNPTIFLAAGEQSGDLHGAELARELRRRLPGARLYGLGGSRMASAGVELLADLDRLAVLGFAEVIRHVPDLAGLRRQVRRFLIERDVDLLVPIDYPGFNLPLARFAHGKGIRVLYYIAPQVWAWHESRARKLGNHTDLVCVVLPFEADLLRQWGVHTIFVGHPLLDSSSPSSTPRDPAHPRLSLFPGSRLQEVRRLLPVFLEAGRHLARRLPGLEVQVARSPDLPPGVYGELGEARLLDAATALGSADAAITKSGTITLQLALAGVPMVVGYRVNSLTYAIASRLITVDDIALVNLVAGRRVVPELVQDEATPDALAASTLPLLDEHDPARARQITALKQVVERLGTPGAAGRVADECVRLISAGGPA
ncbi:MAG: lipid-A-disaccharide synthase [Candidatus Palauibacterales bacterium]|nr:lipid-A-disaccharide synthase [Candidatus Palauibacterales bacterium]